LFADDEELLNIAIGFDDQAPGWKLRAPIKSKDKDELKERLEKCQSGFSLYTQSMTKTLQLTTYLDEESGEIDGTLLRSPLGAISWIKTQKLYGIFRNSIGFKAPKAQYFKIVRIAKQESWEKFLQLNDTDAVGNQSIQKQRTMLCLHFVFQ
jgi:hypothetical protein